MSRQMALQLTQLELLKRVGLVLNSRTDSTLKELTLAEWIELQTEDPKERQRLRAVWVSIDKCSKAGRDVFSISKVIAWRNEKGEPDEIQIEFGTRASRLMLQLSGLLKEDS